MLNRIAEELRQGRKVVLVHGNADMDALGSAYALSKAFPEADIYAPNGLDRVTRMVSEKMDVAILEQCDLSCYDRVVVVDTSSPEQLEGVSDIPGNAIVIDHHRRGEKYIDHYVLSHVDPSASSASELIAILLRYATANPPIPLPASYATVMLAGIFLDSNYFKSKATGARTFEAAEILKDHGADNARADDFLKDGFEEFELTTKIVSSIQTLETGAVYCAAEERQLLPRSTLAKVANQAMQIKSINAVFVIGRTAPDKVNISCRSDGTVNVQLIAEKLGGGGHFQMAAASFPNDICKAQTVQGVVDALKGIVEQYWDSAQAGVSAPAEP